MNTCDIDDSSPSSLLHLRNDGLGSVKVRAQVEGDDFFPHFIWELLNFVNVLDSSVVDQDINSTELLGGLFDDTLGIRRFGQICVDEFSLDSIAADLRFNLLDLCIRCESVENDVGTSG